MDGAVPVDVATMPSGLEVAVYPMIGLPPDAGAVKVRAMLCGVPTAWTRLVGAEGTVAGVTALDGEEGALTPAPLVAVTVNV